MAQNYQTISHKNIAKGMDTKASPNQIAPGFAELLENFDTNTAGFIEKRKGYQSFFGNLPVGGYFDSATQGQISLEQTSDLPGTFVFEDSLPPVHLNWLEIKKDGSHQARDAIGLFIAGTNTISIPTTWFTDGSFIWFWGIPGSYFGSTAPKINSLSKYTTQADVHLVATRNGRLLRELSFAEATTTQKVEIFSGWTGSNSLGSGSTTLDYAYTVLSNDGTYRNWFRPTGSTVTEGGVVCANATSGYVPVASITVIDGDVGAIDPDRWIVDIVINLGNFDIGSDTLEDITKSGTKQGYNATNYAQHLRIQNSPIPGLDGIAIPMEAHPATPTTTVRLRLFKTDYPDLLPTSVTNTSATVGCFDHAITIPTNNSIGNSVNLTGTLVELPGLGVVNKPILSNNGQIQVEFTDGDTPTGAGTASYTTVTDTFNWIDLGLNQWEINVDDQLVIGGESVTVSRVEGAGSVTLDRPVSFGVVDSLVAIAGRWSPIDSLGDATNPTGLTASERVRTSGLADSTFFTDGILNKLVKYDGVNYYTAGIPNIEVFPSPVINHKGSNIVLSQYVIESYSDTGATFEDLSALNPIELQFNSTTLPPVSAGDEISIIFNYTNTSREYVVDVATVISIDTTLNKVEILPDSRTTMNYDNQGWGSSQTAYLCIPKTFYYYCKMSFIDRNSNEIVNSISGYRNKVTFYAPGRVEYPIQTLPKFGNYDYAHIDVELYRTSEFTTVESSLGSSTRKSLVTDTYYRVGRKSIFPKDPALQGWPISRRSPVVIVDEVPDELLTSDLEDDRSVAIKGADLPLSIEDPPKCKYITTINNRAVLGNVTRPPRAEIEFVYSGQIDSSGQSYSGDGLRAPFRGKYFKIKIEDEDAAQPERTYVCKFYQAHDLSSYSGLPDESSSTQIYLGSRLSNNQTLEGWPFTADSDEYSVNHIPGGSIYSSHGGPNKSLYTPLDGTRMAFKIQASSSSILSSIIFGAQVAGGNPTVEIKIYASSLAAINPDVAPSSGVHLSSGSVILTAGGLSDPLPQYQVTMTENAPNDNLLAKDAYYWVEFKMVGGSVRIDAMLKSEEHKDRGVAWNSGGGWIPFRYETVGAFDLLSISDLGESEFDFNTANRTQWINQSVPVYSHSYSTLDDVLFDSIPYENNSTAEDIGGAQSPAGLANMWYAVTGYSDDSGVLPTSHQLSVFATMPSVTHPIGGGGGSLGQLVQWNWSREDPSIFGVNVSILPIPVYARKTSRTEYMTSGYAPLKQETVVTRIAHDKSSWNFSAVDQSLRDMGKALSCVMQFDNSIAEASPNRTPAFSVTYNSGKLILEVQNPNATVTITPEMDEDDNVYSMKTFINGQVADDSVDYILTEKTYPSRVLVSPINHPENYDNPWSQSQTSSDSVVDLNPGDGEVVTGMSSFFGTSSGTSGAQLGDVLIVFKQHSVYAVDLAPDANGIPARQVQKIESSGQGCEFPDSIVAIDDGIFFANRSGIYKVRRDLSVVYEGAMMEGYWNNSITKSSEMIAYEDQEAQRYKLAVPEPGSSENSKVILADYSRSPGEQLAARWATYTNHPVTAWQFSRGVNYFATTEGSVKQLRTSGTDYDYLDDTAGIASTAKFGPTSFGDSGTKAYIHRIITHFDTDTPVTSCVVSSATDMSTIFVEEQSITFDGSGIKMKSVPTSISTNHVHYHQLQYQHSTSAETIKICGYDFKVRSTDELGIPQEE